MKIITDRDLIDDIMDYDVILMGVNIMNTKGNGFNHKMHRSFPAVYEAHRDTPYGDVKKLGTVQVVNMKPVVCLCYISKGRYRPDKISDTVDYEALKNCIELVVKNFPDKRIASTILGVSEFEGGGKKDYILSVFENIDKKYNITLYDYEQVDYRKEENDLFWSLKRARESGEMSREEYQERMTLYKWQRKYGFYAPMPEGMTKERLRIMQKKEKENGNIG